MFRDFDYENKPVVDVVNEMIIDAINKKASDIHFDPREDGMMIRFRIDGDLQDLHIEAFLQKIGKADDRDQEVLIYNPKENLFTSSKPMQKGGQIPLGELILTQDKLFLSPSFEIELEGRWIVSLQITTKDEQIPVILEKEFFGIPKSESITNEAPNI